MVKSMQQQRVKRGGDRRPFALSRGPRDPLESAALPSAAMMRACAAARIDARGAGGLVSSRGLQNILFVGSFNRVNEELA